MNDPTVLTTCVISVSYLTWLWFGPLAKLRRDDYRTDIRRLRDELFGFMVDRGYDFETPAYLKTRQALNGMLRWANWINPVKFCMMLRLVSVSKDESETSAWCPPDLETKISQIKKQAFMRTVKFIFLEGTTGVFVRALQFVLTVFGRINKFKQRIFSGNKVLISEAYRMGEPNLPNEHRAILG